MQGYDLKNDGYLADFPLREFTAMGWELCSKGLVLIPSPQGFLAPLGFPASQVE